MRHQTLFRAARLALFLTIVPMAAAQPGLDVVKAYYKQALSGMQQAKTKEDLQKLVERLDAPDWVSINPTGEVAATRAQTPTAMEPLLAIAPGQRPQPTIEILWVHEEPWRITAVSLIVDPEYTSANTPPAASKLTFGAANQPRFLLAGFLIRDTFARTEDGWRRIKHELLLPYEFSVPKEDSVVTAPE